jgi:hypothetical protein
VTLRSGRSPMKPALPSSIGKALPNIGRPLSDT